MVTVQEGIAQLLGPNEICNSTAEWRPILNEGIVVGLIEVTDERPSDPLRMWDRSGPEILERRSEAADR